MNEHGWFIVVLTAITLGFFGACIRALRADERRHREHERRTNRRDEA